MGMVTRVVLGAVVETIAVHSTGKPFLCRNDVFVEAEHV
jgi:hypothetical protein